MDGVLKCHGPHDSIEPSNFGAARDLDVRDEVWVEKPGIGRVRRAGEEGERVHGEGDRHVDQRADAVIRPLSHLKKKSHLKKTVLLKIANAEASLAAGGLGLGRDRDDHLRATESDLHLVNVTRVTRPG